MATWPHIQLLQTKRSKIVFQQRISEDLRRLTQRTQKVVNGFKIVHNEFIKPVKSFSKCIRPIRSDRPGARGTPLNALLLKRGKEVFFELQLGVY